VALAELEDPAVELGGGDVEAVGRHPLAVQPDAALRQHAPRLRARAPELGGDELR
jgi:hypothetical protein